MNQTVTEKTIGWRACRIYIFGNPMVEVTGDPAELPSDAPLLIQPVDDHDLEVLDEEANRISELSGGRPFALAAFKVDDWNDDLSPWPAPPVFGNEAFGGGAEKTLAYVREVLVPELAMIAGVDPKAPVRERRREIYIGGYSLAGFFALWASHMTGLFRGVAAVSPSVWFPGWIEFAEANDPLTHLIYLSLGDKEERARNPVMRTVGDNIRSQYEILKRRLGPANCVLEMNPGNHFVDAAERTAKGFAWLLRNDC